MKNKKLVHVKKRNYTVTFTKENFINALHILGFITTPNKNEFIHINTEFFVNIFYDPFEIHICTNHINIKKSYEATYNYIHSILTEK